MECYIALDDASTIESVVSAIRQRPQEAALLVYGNSNVDLINTEGNTRDKDTKAALYTLGMEDMGAHLLLKCKLWEI